jgi:seryl-tRNA synthetase
MDFASAGRVSGARFVFLKGALAELERALAQFMLEVHTEEFGYTEILPPFLVREEAAFGTGNLAEVRQRLVSNDKRTLVHSHGRNCR